MNRVGGRQGLTAELEALRQRVRGGRGRSGGRPRRGQAPRRDRSRQIVDVAAGGQQTAVPLDLVDVFGVDHGVADTQQDGQIQLREQGRPDRRLRGPSRFLRRETALKP